MLNPNAQKWVDALRSGEYGQGRRALYEGLTHTFCCLGVACDLFAKANPTEGHWSGNEFFANHESSRASLPRPVADWLGIKRGPGFPYLQNACAIYGPAVGQNLTRDNDTRKHTFDQIADTIEAHQKELFNT